MKNDILVGKLNTHVQKIMNYCKGYTYEAFAADTKLIEACVFNLSQMGELAGKLDDAFSAKHNDIPWRHLYGLRNRIVHDYEGVNLLRFGCFGGYLAEYVKTLKLLVYKGFSASTS